MNCEYCGRNLNGCNPITQGNKIFCTDDCRTKWREKNRSKGAFG